MSPNTERPKKGSAPATMTLDDVRRLASLSRLALSASQERNLMGDFSSILEYFRVVGKVSDAGAPAEKSGPNVVRPDEVAPSDPEGVLAGVPRRKGRLVKAPRVF